MKTRVISAFPGTGKSTYHRAHPDTTLDSDSSEFSWVGEGADKVRNPDFPANYIEHIKENLGKVEFIFVSSHLEVRNALRDNAIFFYLLYPDVDEKEEYIKRYTDRGSPASFIELLDIKWKEWLRECRFDTLGCENIEMSLPMDRELRHIVHSENGDEIVED